MAVKVLIHTYKDPNSEVDFLTLHLDDKTFRMYPGEPLEIENDSNGRRLDNPEFYAHHILQTYGSIYGIVEVPVTKTRSGLTFDIDRALEVAEAYLLTCRHQHINRWAADQTQSRLRSNLPVLPPTGFVEESIKHLNIDVEKKFGFRPVGWDWRPDTSKAVDASFVALSAPLEPTSAMVQENAELKARMARLEEALGLTEPQTEPTTKPKKPKA